MNGILEKFIEITDRIALIGIPDEKRRPEYRARRENYAKREAITEETSAEIPGLENLLDQPEKTQKTNKPIDLLTAKPPEEATFKDLNATLNKDIPNVVSTARVPVVERNAGNDRDTGNLKNLFKQAGNEDTSLRLNSVSSPPQAAAAVPGIESAAKATEEKIKNSGKGLDASNLKDLFKQVETEKKSPRQNLIASLSDVKATELLNDITEVEGLLKVYVNRLASKR